MKYLEFRYTNLYTCRMKSFLIKSNSKIIQKSRFLQDKNLQDFQNNSFDNICYIIEKN